MGDSGTIQIFDRNSSMNIKLTIIIVNITLSYNKKTMLNKNLTFVNVQITF